MREYVSFILCLHILLGPFLATPPPLSQIEGYGHNKISIGLNDILTKAHIRILFNSSFHLTFQQI